MADGDRRNAGRVHPEGGVGGERQSDSDGTPRTRKDPKSVPWQRQRLRAQQIAGARLNPQELMMRRSNTHAEHAVVSSRHPSWGNYRPLFLPHQKDWEIPARITNFSASLPDAYMEHNAYCLWSQFSSFRTQRTEMRHDENGCLKANKRREKKIRK